MSLFGDISIKMLEEYSLSPLLWAKLIIVALSTSVKILQLLFSFMATFCMTSINFV